MSLVSLPNVKPQLSYRHIYYLLSFFVSSSSWGWLRTPGMPKSKSWRLNQVPENSLVVLTRQVTPVKAVSQSEDVRLLQGPSFLPSYLCQVLIGSAGPAQNLNMIRISILSSVPGDLCELINELNRASCIVNGNIGIAIKIPIFPIEDEEGLG